MSVTVTGTVEHRELGPGTWALVTEQGKTYELKDAPQQLCQPQQQVRVEGEVREDVMTFAMIGPVLEVKSFSIVNG
ncbi:MAG: hypothetical protein BRC46_03280 [Cyanobacteria bacterium QS_6_48_18]|nr:MAG: hypothetical protein BRC43_00275 [Cyanobacteria bacterium QS_3_48_167]PSO95198.1 MAG: hypothetical protein BRC46_03280 [Cyanobacteria bacterium QS_6_48_18]